MPSILTCPTYAKLRPDSSECFQNPVDVDVVTVGTHALKIFLH